LTISDRRPTWKPQPFVDGWLNAAALSTPGGDTIKAHGHAYVTVRLGDRRAVLPDIGTHKALDPRVVRQIVDELGLNFGELPGPASRA
jgi:hypothetical protein